MYGKSDWSELSPDWGWLVPREDWSVLICVDGCNGFILVKGCNGLIPVNGCNGLIPVDGCNRLFAKESKKGLVSGEPKRGRKGFVRGCNGLSWGVPNSPSLLRVYGAIGGRKKLRPWPRLPWMFKVDTWKQKSYVL